MKHALLRIGAVALASSVSAAAVFGVGRVILFGDLGIDMPSFAQPTSSPDPSPSPTPTPTVLSETATPAPSPSPTPEPSPTAVPTPEPLALTAFRFEGRSYIGVGVPGVGRTFAAPFAGIVEVRTYQYINGQVRVGSNVAGLPFYPYVSVVAPDRRITYRPGAMGAVTEVLVADGAAVAAGDALFRLIAPGRSSWATFYNSGAPYQVVVSAQSLPSGRDLDAAPYLEGG